MDLDRRVVLLTGASGYVGGRLLAALDARAANRCAAWRGGRSSLRPRVDPQTEVVRGDVREPATLAPALEGIDTAYYLVHSMEAGRAFEAQDREAAARLRRRGPRGRRAAASSTSAASDRVTACPPTSPAARRSGRSCATPAFPTIEFRASVIIGSGSLSFEMCGRWWNACPS